MLGDGAERISSGKSVRKSNANPKETLKIRLEPIKETTREETRESS